jgi:hypothetical protein
VDCQVEYNLWSNFFLQNLSFKAFVAFAFGKLHSSPSSTRVIFVAKATHVLNDKFCRKKLDHLLYYTGSFTTRALEKKRKQEIAFGCVILKKKKFSLKDIREKTT